MKVNRWCCFKNRPPQSDINSCLRNSSLDVSFMNETLQPGRIHSVIVCEEESKNQRDENFCGAHGHSHGHSHSHSHSHGHRDGGSADILSNLGAFGEAIASASSNYYWGTSFANLASNLIWGADVSSISSRVWGFGFATMAVGSFYAHQQLNAYHQNALSKAEGEKSCAQHTSQGNEEENQNKSKLNLFQNMSLVADYFAHTGDVSGAITAGVEEFFKASSEGSQLSQLGKNCLFFGATLVGAVTAIGNVRSCRHAMIEQKKTN